MMVHSWDTVMVVVKVTDNNTGKDNFVDPSAYTQNDRWNKHADMCIQYAHCLKDNIASNALGKIIFISEELFIQLFIIFRIIKYFRRLRELITKVFIIG